MTADISFPDTGNRPDKAPVAAIRARFDGDVERFSNLETGQVAAMDAALGLELVTATAVAATPHARSALDLGCGAGNYSLKLLQKQPGLEMTLVDLSLPMLERARTRLAADAGVTPVLFQGDVRDFPFAPERYDIVLAAAVLHHLRAEAEWKAVFAGVYRSLRPGGGFWLYDMVEHESTAVRELMWARYGDYLAALNGPDYRDHVFAYIDREDTPRPLVYQLDLLSNVGFGPVEVLHKHGCFAAYGGVKPA